MEGTCTTEVSRSSMQKRSEWNIGDKGKGNEKW
jgi:hypothetical protein